MTMLSMPVLISIAAFAGTILFSLVGYLFWTRRQTVRAWEEQVGAIPGADPEQSVSMGGQESLGWFARLIQQLGALNQSKDQEDNSSLAAMLTAAGYRQGLAVATFRGAQLFFGLLLLGVVAVTPKQLLGFPSTLSLLALHVGAGCLGYYAPRVWLQGVMSRRQTEIANGLPDVLDLLVICVEAGLGLDMAIDRVTTSIKSVHKALGEELQLLTLELRAGVTRVSALRNLARRTNVLELRSLVAVLVQTERFGTSIAQALRVQSDVMRTERQLKAEEAAAKLPVKLMIPLIFFIFPVLFIIVLGPALLGVARTLLPALVKH